MRRIFSAMAIGERISAQTTTTVAADKFYLNFLPIEIMKSLALSVRKLWEKEIKSVGESHSKHLAYDFKIKVMRVAEFTHFFSAVFWLDNFKFYLPFGEFRNSCSNLGRIYKLKICIVIIISTVSFFLSEFMDFSFVLNWQCPDYSTELK